MAAGLQYIVEPDQIRRDVGIGVGDAVPHTGLCREVHDHLGTICCEQPVNLRPIGDIALHEEEARMAFQRFQPLLLESHVVIVVHVVDAHDANIPDIGKKPSGKIRPDKTGCTGHQDRLALQFDVLR